MWGVICLENWLALHLLAKIIEVCDWKMLHMYLWFVYSFTTNGPDEETQFIFYFEFLVSLNNFVILAIHALLAKQLSNVVSLFKMGYVSYFNKLLRPCSVSVQNYMWAFASSPLVWSERMCPFDLLCNLSCPRNIKNVSQCNVSLTRILV